MSKSYLKLRELINIPMSGVSLQHIGITERIDDVSLSCLSQYGKEMWDDILEAKLERLGGSTLVISGVSAERFCEFRKLMLGECDPKLYDQCIVNSKTYMVNKDLMPDKSFDTSLIELIATYEDLADIPYDDRVTAYFGDYGMHYMVYDSDMDRARNLREAALSSMEMTQEEFTCSDEFLYPQNIRLRMREGMMADKIQTGDEILFVNAEPLAGSNDFRMIGGRILSVDVDSKTCLVQTQVPKTAVPFRNILARYNEQTHERHFGLEHCEPILGITDNDARTLLREAEELYKQAEQNQECSNLDIGSMNM